VVRPSATPLGREVSPIGTSRQFAATQQLLRAAGCIKVYSEKISGVKTDRPELAKVIKRLETGDVLMVTRLARLARSTRDLLTSWTRSARPVPPSSRWVMRGPIRPRRTVGSC